MREAVIIKSFPNGIALYLNEELPFEKVLEEIGYKFGEARNFFGEAVMALSIEGRSVSNVDEIRILETIHENSDLHIICIVSRDEEANKYQGFGSYGEEACQRGERTVFQRRFEESGSPGD